VSTAADLPEGWTKVDLAEVAELTMGQSPPGSSYNSVGQGLPFFQGKAEFGLRHPTARKWCTEPSRTALAGDVLISVRAPVGPTNLADRLCAIGRGLAAVRPAGAVDPLWLLWALRLQEEELAAQGTGTTFTAISRHHLEAVRLAVPPLAEQKRIVAKVEELLAQVNAARERLRRVPGILRRFRQAVLAAACSGELTAEWRGSAPATPPPSADELAAGGWRRPLKELPPEWHWVSFGAVLVELRNGIATKPALSPPGMPMLRISAVRPGRVLLDDVRYLQAPEELASLYALRDGDLLFTRYNGSAEFVGVCGMLRGLGGGTVLYPDKLIRARLNQGRVLPTYAELFFGAPDSRDRILQKSKTTAGQQGIAGASIKEQPFALPPILEQHEIVRRVDALFALADRIEERVAAATARADRLTQAILAKAFRGELVPTEAELARREGRDYETAAALLARVRAAKSGMDNHTGRQTRRR
jgi:type I restriction enzyme S subunit